MPTLRSVYIANRGQDDEFSFPYIATFRPLGEREYDILSVVEDIPPGGTSCLLLPEWATPALAELITDALLDDPHELERELAEARAEAADARDGARSQF